MRGTPYVHGDFRGGLNTKAANYLLEDSQCRDCLNVQSTTTGAIVKRAGVSQVSTIAAWSASSSYVIGNLVVYNGIVYSCTANVGPTATVPSTDTTKWASRGDATFKSLHATEATTDGDHFIAATDTSLYKVKGNTITSIPGSWSSGYWSQVEATAQDGQGPVFMVNGQNSPQEWDGTTLGPWTMDSSSTLRAPDSAVPNGKYLLVHESRVLIAGESANPSTLFWSEVQVGVGTLPRRWMIENQQLFDPDDGDEITGIGKAGSNLLVFKKHKVFVVYDLNTGASRRLTTNIGCVSHRSIVETPFGTMFLAENGVYVTNGSSVDLVSDQITPTITALSNTNLTTADFYRNHYYLSSPQDNLILDYDLGLKSWWKHTLASGAVYDFSAKFNNSTEEFFCVSGGRVGQMFVAGVYQDFGSSFTWKWAGPWLAPGQAREVYPAVRKRLRALRVDGNGTATMTLSTDFNSAERAVTPQNADGTARASLFSTTSGTTFGPVANDGTYFGDYSSGPSPVTVTSPTVFGDVQGPEQARAWGQGVARSWSVTFKDSVGSGAAATIQNYTIFTQERNQ